MNPGEYRSSGPATLIEMCPTVFIIAYRENTDPLENTLCGEGFAMVVQRGQYSDEEQQYSAALRCLMNHARAWKAIAKAEKPAIVVEAYFVPVRGFGRLPVPMPQHNEPGSGFAWLYSAGSILYGFDTHGFPHGHGNTTVAYIVSPRIAGTLLDFFGREMANVDRRRYSQWETYLGIFLRKERDVLNYIPTYQYGEHGGLPSREHALHGVRAWHQADVLMCPLSFLPAYARGSRLRYAAIRARAIARGWARLALLRFYDPRYINADSSRGRIYMGWFSLARLLRLA